MAAFLAQTCIMILTDEDKGREKDRFERDEQCKEGEGKDIDMWQTRQYVERHPKAEPDHMYRHKGHGAAEVGDCFGDTICACPLSSGHFLQLDDGLDIALSQFLNR